MDPAVASVICASIVTSGTVIVAALNAFKDVDKAVDRAVKPKDERIAALETYIRTLPGGNPDDA